MQNSQCVYSCSSLQFQVVGTQKVCVDSCLQSLVQVGNQSECRACAQFINTSTRICQATCDLPFELISNGSQYCAPCAGFVFRANQTCTATCSAVNGQICEQAGSAYCKYFDNYTTTCLAVCGSIIFGQQCVL